MALNEEPHLDPADVKKQEDVEARGNLNALYLESSTATPYFPAASIPHLMLILNCVLNTVFFHNLLFTDKFCRDVCAVHVQVVLSSTGVDARIRALFARLSADDQQLLEVSGAAHVRQLFPCSISG